MTCLILKAYLSDGPWRHGVTKIRITIHFFYSFSCVADFFGDMELSVVDETFEVIVCDGGDAFGEFQIVGVWTDKTSKLLEGLYVGAEGHLLHVL